MTRAWRILAAAALVVALGPSTAHAALQYELVPDPAGRSAEQPPFAALTRGDVEQLAVGEPEIRAALQLRPGSGLRIRFLPQQRRWRVSVRDRTEAATLASVEVDDATGDVVGRFALPLGEYPSRRTEREAIDAAVEDARVRREARAHGGIRELRANGRIERGSWEVDFYDPSAADPARPVIRADVTDAALEVTGVWTGIQIPWSMARGTRDAFGGDVNEPPVWIALIVLFALVTIDWARLRSWANADVLALLALGVSHEAFQRGEIDWSVPLAVPPMAWLLARMAWLWHRGVPAAPPVRTPRGRLARLALRRVPTVALVVFCVAVAGVRIGLTVDGGNVIDVGYAGVAGARVTLDGEAPWGNMPADVPRGDTYGPANYLAYVPATAALDDPDEHPFGSRMPAAQATVVAADLGCALLLLLVGWRWLSRRAGLLLAAGWLTCPWTTLVLASGANDSLVALGLLAAFALLPHAWLRGALLGLATMVKFAPLVALAPMLHVGSTGRRRQALQVSTGFAVVVAVLVAGAVWRMDGGAASDLRELFQRTVQFQATRDSPFSPWGLYDWELAQRLAQVGVAALVLLACVRPRVRDAWQVAAGLAALLVAVQLLASHWFYLYVPWFVGFVLVVCMAQRARVASSTTDEVA